MMPCIMPERLAKTDPTRAVAEIVGSGPFRFLAGERIPGSLNVYERFDRYVPSSNGPTSFLAGPKIAHLKRVEWRTMPDAATAAAALRAGEIDWWAQPIPDLIPTLRADGTLHTEILDPAGYLALMCLNHLHPPFNNQALRQAVLLAVDQTELMTAAAGLDPALRRGGVGYFTPGPFANENGLGALRSPADPARAREAVAASGYKGERVVFMMPSDYASINGMSEVMADALRRAGLNLDVQVTDWGTMVQRWNSKEPIEKGGWSAYCTTSTALSAINPAENRFLRGLGTKGAQGWPTSPKIEGLRGQFLGETDVSKQKALCAEIQEQAFREVPYVPLGVFYQPVAWRRNVTGQLRGFPLFYNVRKG